MLRLWLGATTVGRWKNQAKRLLYGWWAPCETCHLAPLLTSFCTARVPNPEVQKLAPLAPLAIRWAILTGEYPPDPGGVSDYTRLVARGLADAGDRVVVWAPPFSSGQLSDGVNVEVRRLPDCFGRRSLKTIAEALDGSVGPHRLLVQYVPHAFGWKGANLPFCLWLRGRRRDRVWIMFHEVAYPFDANAGLRPNALAVVNRVM